MWSSIHSNRDQNWHMKGDLTICKTWGGISNGRSSGPDLGCVLSSVWDKDIMLIGRLMFPVCKPFICSNVHVPGTVSNDTHFTVCISHWISSTAVDSVYVSRRTVKPGAKLQSVHLVMTQTYILTLYVCYRTHNCNIFHLCQNLACIGVQKQFLRFSIKYQKPCFFNHRNSLIIIMVFNLPTLIPPLKTLHSLPSAVCFLMVGSCCITCYSCHLSFHQVWQIVAHK